MRPQNVGIHAVEVYFPQTYVKQEDLETFGKIDKGKYTVGLGQLEMAFTLEQEDVNSLSLTVVQNLLEKYNIDPKTVGRLEVGTETLIDKSKSTKTVLMQLFKESGNQDIEGVTSINACYGGTNAIFNTISWIESSSWDGRYGIAICADIAVYDKGPARPTGGAGAIALLLGPDAPIVFDSVRSTYIDHAYDFYKPDPNSEYPTVDGKVSINTYLTAITNCYATLKQKQIARGQTPLKIDQFDFGCFHAPFAKMVQKAFYKLASIDIANGDIKSEPQAIEDIKSLDFDDKKVQAHLNKYAAPIFKQKVAPSLFLGQKLGNIYTGSLYSGLISLLSEEKINLQGKTLLMFSYGSGLASSMFQLRVVKNYDYIRSIINLKERLAQRIPYTAENFDQIMAQKQTRYGKKDYKLENDLTKLVPGAFYLTEVDKFWRRFYKRNGTAPRPTVNVRFGAETTNTTKNTPTLKQAPQESSQVEIQNSSGNGAERLEKISKQFKEGSQKDNHKIWNGFYKKTVMERLDQIQKLNPEIKSQYYLDGGLQIQNAEQLQ